MYDYNTCKKLAEELPDENFRGLMMAHTVFITAGLITLFGIVAMNTCDGKTNSPAKNATTQNFSVQKNSR